jgi:hypothetical protein
MHFSAENLPLIDFFRKIPAQYQLVFFVGGLSVGSLPFGWFSAGSFSSAGAYGKEPRAARCTSNFASIFGPRFFPNFPVFYQIWAPIWAPFSLILP